MMKKVMVVLMALFILLIPVASVSAATFDSVTTNKDYVIWKDSASGKYKMFAYTPNASLVLYKFGNGFRFTDGFGGSEFYTDVYTSDGSTWGSDINWTKTDYKGSSTLDVFVNSNTLFASSKNIYDSVFMNNVFFSKKQPPMPPPPVVKGKVENIPTALIKNLRDGGLLLMGSIILGTLLVVGWVKRSTYSFLR
jgi:hypothetical protein